MLKKIFKKNGMIFINDCEGEGEGECEDELNIKLLYFIVNNYDEISCDTIKKIDGIKKKYYESIGYLY